MCFGHFVWPQNTKVLKFLLQVPVDGNRIVPTGRVRRGPSLLPRILLKSESDHPGSRSGTRRPSDLAQKTQFFQIFCGREKLNQSVETYKLSLLCSVLHLHWDHLVTNKFWTMKNNKFICNQILFQVLHKCFGLRMLFTFVPLGFCGRNWKRNKKVPRDCSFHYPKYPKSENQGRSSAHGWPALVSK